MDHTTATAVASRPGEPEDADRWLAKVLALPPGPELGAGLLAAMARRQWSGRQWLEITVACQQMEGFWAAAKLTGIGELDQAHHPGAVLDGGDPGAPSVQPAAAELAPALRVAPGAAAADVALARRAARLPAAVDAVADGVMTYGQLKVLDQVTRDLPAGARHQVEA